ncbi:hypothetical protein N7510_010096 [Penicillium lagena]|uniref:uncharacterized protein n=1 Tax=Penicillium lagena TaxID=94218 RepID=UPI00253F8228|nr:uncharacterized protein N7510_010096 [Penicillium lagena]KAJ5604942.1 hypothetical protein N7510_010096 [Penicillium lagena]
MEPISSLATKEGFTSLFYAAAYGHAPVVRYFIDGVANVSFENKGKETPIFFAAKGDHEVRLGPRSLLSMGDHALGIKLLLYAAANIDHKTGRGQKTVYIRAIVLTSRHISKSLFVRFSTVKFVF